MSQINWKITQYDEEQLTQTFKSTESAERCDLLIEFYRSREDIETDTVQIHYYENGSSEPSFSKELIITQ